MTHAEVQALDESGFRLVSTQTVPLTPELAQSFRAMRPSRVEREFSEDRVGFLDTKVEQSIFLTPNWASVIIDGEEQRLNGQHTSAMLVARLDAGKFPEGLFVHLDKFEADNEREAVWLFRQIDNRKSARSPADVAGAFQGIVDPLAGVPKSVAKKTVEGIAWFLNSVEKVDAGKGDDRYELLYKPEFHPFILWGATVLNSKTPELKRMPVLGAMWACFDANESAARVFWESVARGGDDAEEGDPAAVLDEWLRAPLEDKTIRHSEIEFFNACAFAWGNYRKSKVVTSIRTKSQTYAKIVD